MKFSIGKVNFEVSQTHFIVDTKIENTKIIFSVSPPNNITASLDFHLMIDELAVDLNIPWKEGEN